MIIFSWSPQEVVLYVCFRTATIGAAILLREIGTFADMATYFGNEDEILSRVKHLNF